MLNLLKIEDNTNAYNQNFKDMGYESALLINNLPDIIILTFIFTIYSSLLFVLESFIKKKGNILGNWTS